MSNKALTESVGKIFFSLIPYAGQLLSETFFDYRSRVKQDRLNSFVESLVQYLQANGLAGISDELQRSEDFGDLFESVIKRVIQTSSREKMIRFRNVIGEYVSSPIQMEYRDTYLDLIERLSEPQIKILKCHALITENISSLLKQRDGLKDEILRLNEKLSFEANLAQKGHSNNYYDYTNAIFRMDKQLSKIKQAIEMHGEIRKPEYYGLSKGDYVFFLQDLFAKGLLVDLGIGTHDPELFKTMGITSFASGFLFFINGEGEETFGQ